MTTKPAGMGLGLALSRELVVAHGGTIRWEKIGPHDGTRFIVELPETEEDGHGA